MLGKNGCETEYIVRKKNHMEIKELYDNERIIYIQKFTCGNK